MGKKKKSNRKTKIVIAVISGIFLIVVALINYCSNKADGEKTDNDNISIENSKGSIQIDQSKNKIENNISGNKNNIKIDNSSNTSYYINSKSEEESSKGYNLSGIDIDFFKSVIDTKKLITINSASNIKIVFEYSGEIVEYSNASKPALYTYTGGFLRIRVTDTCTYSFESLTIPSLLPAPRHIIKDSINNHILKLISSNKNNISNKLYECLKK
jgi:hypothetical protein